MCVCPRACTVCTGVCMCLGPCVCARVHPCLCSSVRTWLCLCAHLCPGICARARVCVRVSSVQLCGHLCPGICVCVCTYRCLCFCVSACEEAHPFGCQKVGQRKDRASAGVWRRAGWALALPGPLL